MELLVISITTLVFVVSVIVFGYFGKISDAKKHRIEYISEMYNEHLLQELELSFSQRIIKKFATRFNRLLQNSKGKRSPLKNKAANIILERQLRLSGIFISAQEFRSLKSLVMFGIIVFFGVVALLNPFGIPIKLLILLVGFAFGVAGPVFFLRFKMRGHQQKIRDQLPDALDLLGVCIEAGLSFDIALIKVAEKLKGPFIDELLMVHREIQMGRTRRDALNNLGESTNIPELKTFVSAIIQAEQLGIPIINVMRIQSAQLRVTRKQLAQEKGMKAPVKMIIPMIIFIFPVIFIVLLGPTVISVLAQLRG